MRPIGARVSIGLFVSRNAISLKAVHELKPAVSLGKRSHVHR
jgi:hypothetical protein